MRREIKADVGKHKYLNVSILFGGVKTNPRVLYQHINGMKKDAQCIPPLKKKSESGVAQSDLEKAKHLMVSSRVFSFKLSIAGNSKTCLKRPLKKDKTKALKSSGSLIKVESIAEFSLGAFCNKRAFCNTCGLH